MIPVVDGNERVDKLHPVFFRRVEALCADPRMEGRLAVESAARTYAEQKYLYDGWIARRPGFNLAANPDRVMASTQYDLAGPGRGSWHMEQQATDGRSYGYAVDFNHSALPARIQAQLEPVAAEYRLIRTVPSEPWHYQMRWDDWTWTPTTTPQEDDVALTEAQEKALAAIPGIANRLAKVQSDGARTLNQLLGRPSSVEDDPRPIRTAIGEISKIVKAIEVGDTRHLADALVEELGPDLAADVADELARRLKG